MSHKPPPLDADELRTYDAPASGKPLRRDPLTVEEILAWADAHKARRGQWPKRSSGPVEAGPLGLNWRMVDNALRHGHRGLPSGSSLARLLADKRGYRNVKALPPLTEESIAAWAVAHHQATGDWPNENSGPVEGAAGEDLGNVNAALRDGHRGLPGGDTLAQLLARVCGARTKPALPQLDASAILAWADRHHQHTGQWPRATSGTVQGTEGETWAGIDAALTRGGRGLAGGQTLAGLLEEHRGVRNARRPHS